MRTKRYLTSFCVILLLVASAVFTCVFVSSPSSHAAGVLTSGSGYGGAHNCPSKSRIIHAPTPNVTLTQQQAYTTINAQTGDIIEVQLPFGPLWSGPTISGGNLALQQPAGYAVNSLKACVWRLLATGPGVTRIDFISTPPCKVGRRCPHLGIIVFFTIAVQ